ncbi:unnamed protein product, partial [Mesorhabditis belari]|uniref:EndoU domain-containing protein n=1 Tax=Mesorhabditis belari TaxID=2138241 RepID=A0AAF3EPR5_9BILA
MLPEGVVVEDLEGPESEVLDERYDFDKLIEMANEYSNEKYPDLHINVSKSELKTISSQLWDLDVNRAGSGDIKINLQGKTPRNNNEDGADETLFSFVNEDLLQKETYRKMIALFDNYQPDLRQEERDTDEMNVILTKPVLLKVFDFLKEKGHPFASSKKEFRAQIRKLWFGRFSRSKSAKNNHIKDTSAFEHTFIGELNRRRVSGMHNWVRYYLLENDENEQIDYRGHYFSMKEDIVVVSYKWKGKNMKKIGGFFVGTSPEYEIAVYTLCFLVKRGKSCAITVNGCPVTLITHAWRQENDIFIDHIYPKIYENGQCVSN